MEDLRLSDGDVEGFLERTVTLLEPSLKQMDPIVLWEEESTS